jgi:transketolase
MSSLKDKLIDSTQKPKASRNSFGDRVAELGEKYPEIVVLDADLSKSTQTQHFAKKYPERFFNMGIAESNMIGTAAGLAMSGYVPFAASFAAFITGRYDQIRMSVAASRANVRLVGTHAGVGIGEDGHSQMGLEDLTLMRSLPNMTVFQPGDDWDTKQFIDWSMKHEGPVYMRLTRQNLPSLKRSEKERAEGLKPGVWSVLNPEDLESADVALLLTGGAVEPGIDAAAILASRGVKPVVINANWIKPLDETLVNRLNDGRLKLIATVEDHFAVGGLGGAVAEVLTQRGASKPLERIGVTSFGQSGTPEANYEHYGFTGAKIADRILKRLG